MSTQRETQAVNWKSEILALVFGALVVFNVFEDRAPIHWVGNLDTIFGQTYYQLMDLVYFFAPIVVFLLYGKAKGSLQLRRTSVLSFVAFLTALTILRLDDFLTLLNYVGLLRPVELSVGYWIAAVLLYVFTSVATFFAFGRSCVDEAAKKES